MNVPPVHKKRPEGCLPYNLAGRGGGPFQAQTELNGASSLIIDP